MESVEVEVINDGVHVENIVSQHERSNVESAIKDSATEEENNAQRQEHADPTMRQRRRPGYLNDYVTNSGKEK